MRKYSNIPDGVLAVQTPSSYSQMTDWFDDRQKHCLRRVGSYGQDEKLGAEALLDVVRVTGDIKAYDFIAKEISHKEISHVYFSIDDDRENSNKNLIVTSSRRNMFKTKASVIRSAKNLQVNSVVGLEKFELRSSKKDILGYLNEHPNLKKALEPLFGLVVRCFGEITDFKPGLMLKTSPDDGEVSLYLTLCSREMTIEEFDHYLDLQDEFFDVAEKDPVLSGALADFVLSED